MSWLFYFASSRVLSGAGSSHLEDRGVRQRKWENNCLFWYFPCWVLLFSLSIQIYYSVQFKNFSFPPSAFYHVWDICLPMINTSVYVLNRLDNLGEKIDGWPLPKNNSGSLGVGPGHPWFSKVPLVLLLQSYLLLLLLSHFSLVRLCAIIDRRGQNAKYKIYLCQHQHSFLPVLSRCSPWGMSDWRVFWFFCLKMFHQPRKPDLLIHSQIMIRCLLCTRLCAGGMTSFWENKRTQTLMSIMSLTFYVSIISIDSRGH